MTRDPSGEPKAPPPITTREEAGRSVPHSGSGAATALLAMLSKRKMRARRDSDPPTSPPDSHRQDVGER